MTACCENEASRLSPVTDDEREKVKAFFKHGRLIQSPAKLAKRHICYRIILERFESGRRYSEKEVNAIIEEVYDDYCEVRRHFVDFGWMERDNGVYWLNNRLFIKKEVGNMKEKINIKDYAGIITEELKRGILLNTQAEKFNSMLIGWGSLGTVWNLPTFTVYVRESRYTKALLDKTGNFTISIPLGNPDPVINRVCGSLSGRDVDKVEAAKLELAAPETNGVPGIRQYPLTIECEVLYSQREEIDKLPERIKETFYPESLVGYPEFDMRDPHTAYIGRIVDAYIIK